MYSLMILMNTSGLLFTYQLFRSPVPHSPRLAVRMGMLFFLLACSAPDKDIGFSDSGLPRDTGDSGDTGAQPIACPESSDPTIESTTGCVVGETWSGGERFRGIPFAAPPVGELRWKRPVPISRWEEPLNAQAIPPACVQSADSFFGDMVAGDGQEDCLYLNVYRPEGAEGLPILFFIHGGGNATGASSEETYVEPLLAEDAVVVTTNYRLGVFGWLAHPELSAEDEEGISGNYGLLDSLEALKWVSANAEALGGDPERVLVFGESAGALDTCALWMSPAAEGLFQAATMQSGPCTAIREPMTGGTEEEGENYGEAVADALGCSDLTCMRAASPEALLAATPTVVGMGEGHRFGPLVDGVLLPMSGVEAIQAGAFAQVPVVFGVNADEGTIFTTGAVATWVGLEATLQSIARSFGMDGDAIVARYGEDAGYADPDAAFAAFYGDVVFLCPTVWLADAVATQTTTRAYYFDYAPTWAGDFGAFHGVEVSYLFGLALAEADNPSLGAALRDAWTAMPGGEPWPTLDQGWYTWSETGGSLGGAPGAETCAFWAEQGLNTILSLRP